MNQTFDAMIKRKKAVAILIRTDPVVARIFQQMAQSPELGMLLMVEHGDYVSEKIVEAAKWITVEPHDLASLDRDRPRVKVADLIAKREVIEPTEPIEWHGAAGRVASYTEKLKLQLERRKDGQPARVYIPDEWGLDFYHLANVLLDVGAPIKFNRVNINLAEDDIKFLSPIKRFYDESTRSRIFEWGGEA